MWSKRYILLHCLISLLILPLHAQSHANGLPWIQNYHFSETGGSEQNWCMTQDFRGVIYVGNNNNGVLEYDGSRWRTIPVPGEASVRSMARGEDGFIYVGLQGNFGRLEPNRTGNMQFRSLVDSSIVSRVSDVNIWQTHFQEGKAWFSSQDAIFVYDPATNHIEIFDTPEHAFFSFFANESLYMGAYVEGLMKFDGESFLPVPGGEAFSYHNISGLAPLSESKLLLATMEKGLWILDLEKETVDSSFMDPGLNQELVEAFPVHLLTHKKSIYVCTMNEGLYILDIDGKLSEHYSEREGLLNNSVMRVHIPLPEHNSGSVWLVHWMGVSRVDINSPFRSIPVGMGRPGFGGRVSGELITDITEFQGKFFISTFGGLYQRGEREGRSGYRPMRGLREAINDLEVLRPEPGLEFLLVSASSNTYVIDKEMNVTSLDVVGSKIVADPEHPARFYTGGHTLSGIQYQNGQWKNFLELELGWRSRELCLDKRGYLWGSQRYELLRINLAEGSNAQTEHFGEEEGLPSDEQLRLFNDPESGDILIGTNQGFYQFNYQTNKLSYDSLFNSVLPVGDNEIMTFHKGKEDMYWFSFENDILGWSILGAQRDRNGFQVIWDRPFRLLSWAASTDVFYTDKEDQLWFSKSNQLFHFEPDLVRDNDENLQVLIRNVEITGDSIVFQGTNYSLDPEDKLQLQIEQSEGFEPDLSYKFRDVEFQWSSPYYRSERQIRYAYMLDGFSAKWSDWDRSRSAKFTNLKHGRYELKVKAQNVFGDESIAASYTFTILRPWYATVLAIALYVILTASLAVFVMLYTRGLKRKAELLERQNREIELQKKELENLNEEITAQRDEIEAQRDSISDQKELIDRQKNAITDSIHYARRIQDAVLPAKEVMRFLLPKHFVFYRPRDIVSGDFFWVDKKDETIWIAVADCTGHGVPGAFMSMLGISLLNEISSKYSGRPTNEIMDELRDQVIASLGQTGDRYEAKDGMEMGLVAINIQTREVQFSGAMHNLCIFHKGELVILKGDRMPVGIHSEGSTMFSSRSMKLDRGDTLYLFSDGYADQFGGEQRKKFGTMRLKKLLTDLQNNIMHDQKEAIKREFEQWKGEEEQIDDVLLVGIKL